MINGYRKAALKLHTMSAKDREWLLQQFTEDEQASLTELLRELQELGIKSDFGMSGELSADETIDMSNPVPDNEPEVDKSVELLCAARAEEIAMLLSNEPDMVAGVVLSAYPWPWRSQLLASYGVEARLRASRALSQAQVLRPKVRSELIRMMASRLAAARVHAFPLMHRPHDEHTKASQVQRKRSRWHRLRRWLP